MNFQSGKVLLTDKVNQLRLERFKSRTKVESLCFWGFYLRFSSLFHKHIYLIKVLKFCILLAEISLIFTIIKKIYWKPILGKKSKICNRMETVYKKKKRLLVSITGFWHFSSNLLLRFSLIWSVVTAHCIYYFWFPQNAWNCFQPKNFFHLLKQMYNFIQICILF